MRYSYHNVIRQQLVTTSNLLIRCKNNLFTFVLACLCVFQLYLCVQLQLCILWIQWISNNTITADRVPFRYMCSNILNETGIELLRVRLLIPKACAHKIDMIHLPHSIVFRISISINANNTNMLQNVEAFFTALLAINTRAKLVLYIVNSSKWIKWCYLPLCMNILSLWHGVPIIYKLHYDYNSASPHLSAPWQKANNDSKHMKTNFTVEQGERKTNAKTLAPTLLSVIR